jgi:hypothetical protein
MANCMYCAHPAGFLKNSHAACEKTHHDGVLLIRESVRKALKGNMPLGDLRKLVMDVSASSKIPDIGVRGAIALGWKDAVDDYLQDGLIDAAEEQRLSALQQAFSLTQQDLDAEGAYTRVAKAGVLRNLMQGQLPARVSVAGGVPVNLQKGESVIWAFRNVEMLEDKVQKEYVGRSQGMSFRIMKGVYYRVGGFKGRPVETTHRIKVDTGMVIVTDRNIYFAGPSKSVRVPFNKIIAFNPYDDGVGIMRDSANAKALVFVTGDGWFSYNLLVNVANI